MGFMKIAEIKDDPKNEVQVKEAKIEVISEMPEVIEIPEVTKASGVPVPPVLRAEPEEPSIRIAAEEEHPLTGRAQPVKNPVPSRKIDTIDPKLISPEGRKALAKAGIPETEIVNFKDYSDKIVVITAAFKKVSITKL